ncbi:glycosyltransferase [Agromyces humatus]|uniref:Glycosyltransferase n=1 Tax=Agromyces humatus TaxID=279573 RepID=A0ABP4WAM1_9MICO|nr:glycosyltransferase [Agromyces humatus]
MRKPQRVLVFPAWTDNPYLNLMSLAPRASGREFIGVKHRNELFALAKHLDRGDILHLHWTSPLLQEEADDADARATLGELVRLLSRLRDRGVKLVWTIHNHLPHELAYREPEVELYRTLAQTVDAIHTMSPHTPDALAGICELPGERIRQIPHPSYVGVYGAPVATDEARRQLGADPARPAVLFLGQMRPYKGLDLLITAMNGLSERDGGSPTLLLAGSADAEAKAIIDATLNPAVDVVARFDYVHDSEIATWFGAANLAVFPYRAILNSGSVHLASAFEVPVVLPGEPHLVEQFSDQAWVDFFDTSDPVGSLTAAIERSLQTPVDASDFDVFNARFSPWKVSESYRALLDELTASSTPAAEAAA